MVFRGKVACSRSVHTCTLKVLLTEFHMCRFVPISKSNLCIRIWFKLNKYTHKDFINMQSFYKHSFTLTFVDFCTIMCTPLAKEFSNHDNVLNVDTFDAVIFTVITQKHISVLG